MFKRKLTFPVAVLLLALYLICPGCASAPDIPPAYALDTYDDAPYAKVLDAAVRDGLVDYAAITAPPAPAPGSQDNHADTPRDYSSLDGQLDLYLDAVARFGPESTPDLFPTEDDQLAYYLNAYNAIMLRLWLDKGARTADADDGVVWWTWFTVNQWKIDQRTMSLDYLEQRLIRPTFKEARIHAALVCGAIDCPPLRDEPFVGESLDAQLDGQMRDWLNGPAENAIEIRDNGKVYLAKILGWYRDDFRPDGGLEAVIETYVDQADPRKAPALEALRNNKIKFQGYDWSINKTP